MFPFKQTFETKNKSKGKNLKKYIVIHHTATPEWSVKGVIRTLTTGAVSCHFVVDTTWEAYKIGSPDDILWHMGESQWGSDVGMNLFSLWIEVIGPMKNGWFTREQLLTVTRLVEHLMAVFSIPKENIIRHKDCTHDQSKNKVLWKDGMRSRKVDIYDNFFPNNDFVKWRNQLTPKQQ